MTKVRTIWAVAMAAAVFTVAAARADEADDARKEVLDLVKDLAGNKDIVKKAKAAAEKHDLDHVMAALKARDKRGRGGVGAGKVGDGIEKAIDKLSDKELSAADLKAMEKDLLQLARVNRVIAELTPHYGEARAKNDAQKKLWKKSSEDMKKASDALVAAVQGKSAVKVKAAATDLSASCTACHREFRQN